MVLGGVILGVFKGSFWGNYGCILGGNLGDFLVKI